jgi:uncharacterized surface anchored protein
MELKDILSHDDLIPTFVSNDNLGSSLSRGEIEYLLEQNGYTIPLAKGASFTIVSATLNTAWQIRYIKEIDKYCVKKCNLK